MARDAGCDVPTVLVQALGMSADKKGSLIQLRNFRRVLKLKLRGGPEGGMCLEHPPFLCLPEAGGRAAPPVCCTAPWRITSMHISSRPVTFRRATRLIGWKHSARER